MQLKYSNYMVFSHFYSFTVNNLGQAMTKYVMPLCYNWIKGIEMHFK